MFTYAEAEKLLGRLYYVPDERALRGAFRARLKHLKRLGVPLDSSPGKGVKVAYEAEHLYQWAFCLELAEFGLDPTIIVKLLKANWKTMIFKEFQKAEQMWRRAIKDDPELKFEWVPPSIAAREYTDDYFFFFLALHPMRLMSSTWEPRSADSPRIMGLNINQIHTVTIRLMENRNWLVFDIMQIVQAVQFGEDSKTMQPREAEDEKNLTDLIARAKEIAVADNINVEQALRRLSPPDNPKLDDPKLATMIRLRDTSMPPSEVHALRRRQYLKELINRALQLIESKVEEGEGQMTKKRSHGDGAAQTAGASSPDRLHSATQTQKRSPK
jgi:hypothetical protein